MAACPGFVIELNVIYITVLPDIVAETEILLYDVFVTEHARFELFVMQVLPIVAVIIEGNIIPM